MKKFFAALITLLYLLSSSVCYAFNELYHIKYVDKAEITDQLSDLFVIKNYTVQKVNPYYYAISNKDPETYIAIALEPYGQNYLYYYESNNDKKFNKAFIKYLNEQNIIYEKSYNEITLNRMAEMVKSQTHNYVAQNQAQTNQNSFQPSQTQPVVSTPVKQYTFTDPDDQQRTVISYNPEVEQTPPTTLKGFVGTVGAGSALHVYLQDPINTATASVGNTVIGVLKEDWRVKGRVIAAQGSVLYGTITKANHARAGMRNGGVSIDFNKLATPDGNIYNLTTQKIDFDVDNEGHWKKAATSVVAASAVGALVGLAFALLGGGDIGTGAAIGAGVAGGVSLIGNVAEKGVDAEIPSYTDLEVIVERDIQVVINY